MCRYEALQHICLSIEFSENHDPNTMRKRHREQDETVELIHG